MPEEVEGKRGGEGREEELWESNLEVCRHAPSPAAHRRQRGEITCPGPGNRLHSKHEQCSHVSALPAGLCSALDKLSYSFPVPPCGTSASFSAGCVHIR